MRNQQKTALLVAITLIFIMLFTFSVSAENLEEELDEMRDKVLEEKEEIASAEYNVNPSTQVLASLPEPEEKPTVAVFSIEDKTGQLKDVNSQVVTQGAEDMLITALKRSRQFNVLERIDGNFETELELQEGNLLAADTGPEMGEMTGADYIIEGAVTEYQVDFETGGLGLTVAGLGGYTQYAKASTAIDLRVVDTTSGEVVWSRSLRDEIKGEKSGLQAFAFMGDNITELETGSGAQQIINLVVRSLLEEAVFMLAESKLN